MTVSENPAPQTLPTKRSGNQRTRSGLLDSGPVHGNESFDLCFERGGSVKFLDESRSNSGCARSGAKQRAEDRTAVAEIGRAHV